MNIFRSRPWLRWAVPGVAAVLLTGSVLVGVTQAVDGGLQPAARTAL